MDYGIRVAKAGFDVLTDSDANMAFTSKRYSDVVYATFVMSTVMGGATTRTLTFAHNLGYVPQFRCFWPAIGGAVNAMQVPANISVTNNVTGVTTGVSPQVFADSTNLYIRIVSETPDDNTHYFRVYIFEKGIL